MGRSPSRSRSPRRSSRSPRRDRHNKHHTRSRSPARRRRSRSHDGGRKRRERSVSREGERDRRRERRSLSEEDREAKRGRRQKSVSRERDEGGRRRHRSPEAGVEHRDKRALANDASAPRNSEHADRGDRGSRPAPGPERGGRGEPRNGADRGGGRGRGEPPEKFEQEARYHWGKPEDNEEMEKPPTEPIYKPDFGLTGALAKDSNTGNVYKGVQMKWSEPEDAIRPERGWRLYVFKAGELINTLHLHRQSAYLFGRHDVADLKLEHKSCSKQHAVMQFRVREVKGPDGSTRRLIKPYIMDLDSVNHTKLNGEVLDDSRYYELKPQDTIQFGFSTREYVLLHENMVEANKAADT